MISVIIPTYNESDVIGECLKSLENQNIRDFEVIVVDDGSSDETFDKLSKFAIHHKSVTIFRQDQKGPGAARNLGATHAKGDILVFVDADMKFSRNFLKELIKPIVKKKSLGTFSKQEFVSNWDNVWARCWNINEGWGKRMRHPKKYPSKQKVFRAILKSEFVKVGGFEPGGYTDDYSLSEKLGYLAEEAKGAVFFHKNPSGLREVFYHAKWVGKRKYKLGTLGYFVALIRASFPVSIVIGILKSVFNLQPAFVLFKVVYDFGITAGIVNYLKTKRGSK